MGVTIVEVHAVQLGISSIITLLSYIVILENLKYVVVTAKFESK